MCISLIRDTSLGDGSLAGGEHDRGTIAAAFGRRQAEDRSVSSGDGHGLTSVRDHG
jgi:hypothetical protein